VCRHMENEYGRRSIGESVDSAGHAHTPREVITPVMAQKRPSIPGSTGSKILAYWVQLPRCARPAITGHLNVVQG